MKLIMIAMAVLSLILYSDAAAQEYKTDSFKVAGICGECRDRIQKALNIKGVQSARYDLASQTVTVSYDPSRTSIDIMQKAVAAVGHDTEKYRATDKNYNSLDECCRYRQEEAEHSVSGRDHGDGFVAGMIRESRNEDLHPLPGASIHWAGTPVGTTSNAHGEFVLPFAGNDSLLVVSYAGFKTDTISTGGLKDINITLNRKEELTSIVITARSRPSYIDGYSPFRTNIITKKELLKAACCNLSESFETNPSVDVSYSDAVTGSKQIQLLGLAGKYTQLTVENLPGPRGLATPLGLNSIAGPWVESIQLIKGTGSVVNGFESIAGQVNVELRKPRTSEKLYVNGYINSMAKTDININWSQKISDNWWTGLLLHDNFLYTKQDANNDGYLDLPTGNQFSGVHRWEYLGDNGLVAHFGVKALLDNRTGGEKSFDPVKDKFTTNAYGLGIKTNRYEVFAKTGYVFPEQMYKSFGLQLSAFTHRQNAYFGLNEYLASQQNIYANLIYQTRIVSDKHKVSAGFNFIRDHYDEELHMGDFIRDERTAGAFAEYTYQPGNKLDIVAGLRTDHNNIYGWFVTPRLNIRYAPVHNTTIRFSMGRGQRTANIFAEQIGLLTSNRMIEIQNAEAGKAYGLDAEVSWNKGVSLDQKFRFFGNEASLGLDFYRTDFVNQVVVDMENLHVVKFYNLQGKSFSNSAQAELQFSPVKKLDARIAYRFFDVRTDYDGVLKEKPLTARHRAFMNLAYDLKGWKMDYTINYTGSKRIPSTAANPQEYRLPERSEGYITMNAQVSKMIGKGWDLYIGGENLGQVMQKKAILGADQPFSDYFDASLVWGPLSGRMIYAGFRYSLK